MKVSVVIPLYNAREVIQQTIETVLSQTWTDHEIIVVDDGSCDGSGDLVNGMSVPVCYLRQNNAGVARARNRGIRETKGLYIALLDHDDLWHPTKLEKQVGVLDQRPEVGMVITDVIHIDRDGKPMARGPGSYNPAEDFARLFVKGFVPTPSAALIRRSLFDEVGLFDERFSSAGLDDHELWTRIASRTEISNIAEPLTLHRVREIKPPQVALEHRALLYSILMERFGYDAEKRRYLLREQASCLADQGKQFLYEGKKHLGRSYLVKGLGVGLCEAMSLKIAWRCLSRLVRSYVYLKQF